MVKRIIKNLDALLHQEKVIVKWSRGKYTSKNVGDAANEFLFEKIFKKKLVNYKETLNLGVPPVYSFIGSVLDNSAVRNLTVLGSGFKREGSPLPVLPKNVIACRGPLTRKKLLESGMTEVPEVYGDPAILLPKYINPDSGKKYRMGVIPHYTDKANQQVEALKNIKDVKIIDIFSGLDGFIREIKACDFTISSSLHGIIISHAFGVPSGWLKLSDNLAGGGFKFLDYSFSAGYEIEPIYPDKELNINSLEAKVVLPELDVLSEKLFGNLKNFQFD